MRILIITPYVPYPGVPHGGGQDLFDLILYLGQRHEIRVACFADKAQAAYATALRPYVAALDVIRPALTLRDRLGKLLRGDWQRADLQMQEIVMDGWADVLVAVWTEMGRYLDLAPAGTLRVLDEVDVRFVVDESLGHPDRHTRHAAEIGYCQSADLVMTRSIRDLSILQSEVAGLQGLVVPPVGHVEDYLSIDEARIVEGRVLFVGAMRRRRNQMAAHWLIEEIWPHINRSVSKAHLRVVGEDPPRHLQSVSDSDRVAVIGWVEDLREEYASASVIVAPMRSEAGALNKVHDGLAAGRPVVATSLANAALDAPVIVADEAQAFAQAVIKLLQDRAEWQLAARAGRDYIRAEYDRRGALVALEQQLVELVSCT